jgi:hypothetical protein
VSESTFYHRSCIGYGKFLAACSWFSNADGAACGICPVQCICTHRQSSLKHQQLHEVGVCPCSLKLAPSGGGIALAPHSNGSTSAPNHYVSCLRTSGRSIMWAQSYKACSELAPWEPTLPSVRQLLRLHLSVIVAGGVHGSLYCHPDHAQQPDVPHVLL